MTTKTRDLRRLRFDSPEQELFLNLWRTYDRLRALEDELFGRYDLTAQQYNALRLLGASYPRPLATLELASRLVSRSPDITRMLDRLHARGLVARERPEDNRRTVQVILTDAGRNLLDEIDLQVRNCHRKQVGHLESEEMAALTDLLRRARAPHEPDNSAWG